VKDGNADPDWAQAVLWQNSADWNFDRVSGETGNGFVQWTSGDGSAAPAAAKSAAGDDSNQDADQPVPEAAE
jgi:hypothetical protein